ncbi:hypothetical protein ACJX0J_011537, partial [Zea mays]
YGLILDCHYQQQRKESQDITTMIKEFCFLRNTTTNNTQYNDLGMPRKTLVSGELCSKRKIVLENMPHFVPKNMLLIILLYHNKARELGVLYINIKVLLKEQEAIS